MSEAVVSGETRPSSNRFFCHSCTMEIDRVSADFTCPICSEGFIEELPEATASSDSHPEPEVEGSYFRLANDLLQSNSLSPSMTESPYFRIANEILSPMFLAATNRSDPTDHEASSTAHSSDTLNNPSSSTNTGATRRRHTHHRRPGQINFENFLQEVLISISDGANVGGTPMFFMGNPGDYAWGREGLDTIVTQLLNQMDNSGPPPLDKEKINEIPKVEITADQVDIKLQCSVCWEDFKLNETVRKLACSHVYHEGCIIPWLELHGTCPICRQSLAPECEMPDEQTRVNSWTSTAQHVVNQIRNSIIGEHSSASAPATSTPIPQEQQNQSQSQATSTHNQPEQADLDQTLDFSISSIDMSTTDSEAANSSNPTDRNNSNNSSSRMRDDEGNVEFEFD